MRPSKPSSRSASAALAPAIPAPTITWVLRSGMCAPPCQRQELLARAWVVANESMESRRDGGRPRLGDAAQGHAHVLGLQDDSDTLRRQLVLQPVADLCGQPLLHLQPPGEEVDHARELRQSDDPLTRQVAHVRDADE